LRGGEREREGERVGEKERGERVGERKRKREERERRRDTNNQGNNCTNNTHHNSNQQPRVDAVTRIVYDYYFFIAVLHEYEGMSLLTRKIGKEERAREERERE
jgi:hypothetical protein